MNQIYHTTTFTENKFPIKKYKKVTCLNGTAIEWKIAADQCVENDTKTPDVNLWTTVFLTCNNSNHMQNTPVYPASIDRETETSNSTSTLSIIEVSSYTFSYQFQPRYSAYK